jgi:uncharacterized protein
MPGFPRVLQGVADAYRERSEDVAQTAASILSELNRLSSAAESNQILSLQLLDQAYSGIIRSYDRVNGGFGSAPKFPPAMTLEFLLRIYYRTKRGEALDIVAHTARKMAEGGIYDQLGGGFHRYSTDSKWLVPHFEKMLYDNALLARLYLHYYQVTGDEFARLTVEGTLDYVVREMTDPAGGFYSTQDADSEGHEGKFFVWDYEEIKELLGTPDASLFSAYYNVTKEGNFEGKNILNVTPSIEEVAAEQKVSVEHLRKVLETGRRILFEKREQRVKPGRDEKILTAWNGLMLASFAEAAAILGRDDYAEVARKNAAFVLENLRRDGLLLRTYKDGQAKLNAYLEDYAFLIDGLLLLFETTGESRWIRASLELAEKMIEEFWDSDQGGFFFTGTSHEELIVRSKDYFDNATPSGNSVAADVLLRLALLTNNDDFKRRAVTVLRLIADSASRYPSGFGRALSALDFYLGRPKEVVIVGTDDHDRSMALRAAVWQPYLPNKVVAEVPEERIPQLDSLLAGRTPVNGSPAAYVCEQYTCQRPITEPSELATALRN